MSLSAERRAADVYKLNSDDVSVFYLNLQQMGSFQTSTAWSFLHVKMGIKMIL